MTMSLWLRIVGVRITSRQTALRKLRTEGFHVLQVEWSPHDDALSAWRNVTLSVLVSLLYATECQATTD
jgi:hypothetical protein